MNGITNTSPEQLEAFLNRPVVQGGRPQPSAQVTSNLITKVAHEAARINEQRRKVKHQTAQLRQKRSGVLRAQTRNSLTKISQYQALIAMQRAGCQLDNAVLKALPGLKKEAMAEMEALEDRVIEHDELKTELMDDLIDAASEDPAAAADMIQEATGEDVSPDEVEAAANEVAEVLVKDEVNDGPTKESSNQRARIQGWAQVTPEFVQRVILARATTKASSALQSIFRRQG